MKTGNHSGKYLLRALILGSLLYLLPRKAVTLFIRDLLNGNAVRRLEFLVNSSRWEEVVTYVGFFALSLFFIFSILGFIFSLVTSKGAPKEASPRKHVPAGTAAAGKKADAHQAGKDEYLEQLESFLKSDLITREEYGSLRDRYLKRR